MILIVDDDDTQRRMTAAMMTAAGRPWVEASGGEAAIDLLSGPAAGTFRLVLLDLAMPDLDGMEVLSRIRPIRRHLPVIVLTALSSVSHAVAAMRAGAQDFLIKPISSRQLEDAVRDALGQARAARRPSERRRSGFDGLIAKSPTIVKTIRMAERGARSGIPILIEGESGVGKEVFARAIHASSDRAERPFVAVNCGALPEMLVESLLFGHEKGAFTGAVARRAGKFEEADGGVLFLDEIGDLPLEAQVKLLRAVQDGEIDPVGGARTVKTDIRLISATNRDLAAEVEAGRFREDLYYRISVFPLSLPPLRRRREDIIPLAERFISRFAAREGRPAPTLSDDARALLAAAPWPGNVRQLENAIHRAVVLSERRILSAEDFAHLRAASCAAPIAGEHPFFDPSGHIRPLAEIETAAVETALSRYGGSMTEAARRLEIGRSTLYRKTRDERAAG
ncbi:sigma-54 dependent transcriptional regulator [Pikeienuella sp. HZG-20]|uniref:sigma-54-dependent transcriptional regulator n=1 Tax=Paludibacillus litoralis TaxID=3133267 RepID=UPI0030EF1F6A